MKKQLKEYEELEKLGRDQGCTVGECVTTRRSSVGQVRKTYKPTLSCPFNHLHFHLFYSFSASLSHTQTHYVNILTAWSREGSFRFTEMENVSQSNTFLGILPLSTSLSDSQAVSLSVSPFLLFSDTTLLLHHSSIFLLHHLDVSLPVIPYFIFLIIIPIIQKPQRSKFMNSVFLSIYCVIYQTSTAQLNAPDLLRQGF